jgi:hypothetical protein
MITRKPMLKYTTIALATVVLSYASARSFYVHSYAQTNLHVRPYIAEQVSFKSGLGKEVITERRTVSRRRDGSLHRSGILYRSDGTEAWILRRVDFADGLIGMIIDAVHAKATGYVSQSRLAGEKAFMLNPPPNCALPGESVDGEEILFGYRAIRLVRERAPGKLMRDIQWRLVDFGCEGLQLYIQSRPTDSGEWTTVGGLRLVSIVEAEPDERLFNDWSQYEELKPSDIKRRLAAKAAVTAEQCPKCFADDSSDQGYLLANVR